MAEAKASKEVKMAREFIVGRANYSLLEPPEGGG